MEQTPKIYKKDNNLKATIKINQSENKHINGINKNKSWLFEEDNKIVSLWQDLSRKKRNAI